MAGHFNFLLEISGEMKFLIVAAVIVGIFIVVAALSIALSKIRHSREIAAIRQGWQAAAQKLAGLEYAELEKSPCLAGELAGRPFALSTADVSKDGTRIRFSAFEMKMQDDQKKYSFELKRNFGAKSAYNSLFFCTEYVPSIKSTITEEEWSAIMKGKEKRMVESLGTEYELFAAEYDLVKPFFTDEAAALIKKVSPARFFLKGEKLAIYADHIITDPEKIIAAAELLGKAAEYITRND